ncbi:MAG: hypothetical protein LBE82_07455, partial [Chitinophagaceae bacterium]|nr:hypothetical protein [Chitinophagaceae bacterium]
TEKVFIDGVQMQRGEDQDYTINYNTAQITFMPRQMITKDKRVQIEFEYSDQSYLSSMFFLSNETKFGNKFTLLFSAYQNADSKNSPINQTLNNEQRQFLANLGDSIQNAYYPAAGIDTAFSPTKILYKKIDTVYNSIHDSIFVYSTDSSVAKYNLSFIQVGANKGNYVPMASAANGISYQWVAPVNGVPQGNYEPAQFLTTPKKLVVYSLAGAYQLSNKTLIKTELASSNYNVNTFSEVGKKNDVDYAGKIDIAHTEKWQTENGKKYTMLVNAGYEGVGKYFHPAERLRAVEFYRDWGMTYIPPAASEKLLPVGFQLNDNKNNLLKYNFVRYTRSDGFTGYQNIFSHSLNTKNGWETREIFNLTNITASDSTGYYNGYKGYYFRPKMDINKTFQKFHNYTIGASYAMERNDIKYTANDSMAPQSFAFETIGAYIKSDIQKRNHWSFSYFTRTNQLPYGKNLVETDRSNNYNLSAEFMKNPKEQLRVNIAYRQLTVKNDSIINQKSNNSLLGRVEYLVREWKGFLVGNVLYEIGGGQEQKRAYSYIQVPAGTGQYVWIDYNHDGIAQLNEFEPAVFSDQGNYIKIFTPNNDYVNANYTQFNYSLTLNPKMLFDAKEKPKGWRNVASRLYLQSSLQTTKKQISAGGPTFNPLQGKAADTSILNLSYLMNTTLSFNRTSPVWSGDVTNMINNGKALLTYGTQETHINQWTFNGRFTIVRRYTFEMQQKLAQSSLITPAFNNQNYIFNISSSLPAISYTNGTKYRLRLGYEYTVNKNALEYGGEKAITNALNFEAKYNAVQNTGLLGRFTLNNISFTGTPNTAISYNMLNGLQEGRNLLWTIDFTKRLFNNLELSIQYEGRKPGDTRVINIGRASIRAVL